MAKNGRCQERKAGTIKNKEQDKFLNDHTSICIIIKLKNEAKLLKKDKAK